MATPLVPNLEGGLDFTDQLAAQLSRCLGVDVVRVKGGPEAVWRPGAVFKIEVMDAQRNTYPLVLKRQDYEGAYSLYQDYLKPYQLDSPHLYGDVVLDHQRFLVMDFVRHVPEDWGNGVDYLRAVKWLIKKDRISGHHLDALRALDCLGQWHYYGLDDWLPEFERWHDTSPQSDLAKAVWQRVGANRSRINDTIAALNTEGAQTVVHGDLTLGNVLFVDRHCDGELEDDPAVFVIDWTQPHISSVTKDLASLYDNAPQPFKGEVVRTYREAIDFPQFERTFAKAMLLRDIGYLAWMAGMINDGHSDEIGQSEVERVANSLLAALRERESSD